MASYLANNPFFQSFEQDLLDLIAPHCRVIECEKGDQIISRGEDSGDVFVIETGTVEVVVCVNNFEQVVAEIGRGGIIGELSMILKEPHGATVRAKDDASYVKIPQGAMRVALATDARWPSALLQLLSRKLKNTTKPLARLCVLAEMLTEGRLDKALLRSLDEEKDSLGPLASTFQSMARYVTERTERLEQEVAERTAALTKEIQRREQIEEDLRRLASTDPLTGAANRRSFFEAGGAELDRATRYDRPVALMMLDIDHFKKVNDTYGHAAGDQVLKEFVACCRDNLRPQDLLGRLGGEEFAVLAPECSSDAAFQLAERLRRQIADMAVEVEEFDSPVTFTVSIGLLNCDSADGLEKLLEKADAALYQAKRSGRNRVELAQ